MRISLYLHFKIYASISRKLSHYLRAPTHIIVVIVISNMLRHTLNTLSMHPAKRTMNPPYSNTNGFLTCKWNTIYCNIYNDYLTQYAVLFLLMENDCSHKPNPDTAVAGNVSNLWLGKLQPSGSFIVKSSAVVIPCQGDFTLMDFTLKFWQLNIIHISFSLGWDSYLHYM